jgi:hypothetical protein
MANSVAAEEIRHKAKIAEQQGNRALAEQLRREAEQRALTDVFGQGFRRDKHGNPMEQGLGAPGNETEQNFAAILKYEGPAAEQAARERAARYKANK